MTGVNLTDLRNRLAEAPAGARIEFGVFKGATLAEIAKHGGKTIGVDSFEGMAEPTERDMFKGGQPYPKGRLAAGMEYARRVAPKAVLVRGFVPDVLSEITDTGFAFAHLDMDQFAPTLAVLDWIAPRMVPGGVVVCDDWFAGRNVLAAGAINQFAAGRGIALKAAGRMAWFKC